jgi:hypothetical protein
MSQNNDSATTPLHSDSEVDSMLRQIQFKMEYPFRQYASNATVCTVFNTFDELKNNYESIVRYYESLSTKYAQSVQNKDANTANTSNDKSENTVGIVEKRVQDLPYYLVQVRLVDGMGRLIRQYSHMSDSYRRIRRLSNHHLYHSVLSNNSKLYFADVMNLNCDCSLCSPRTRFSSEFFDPYYLYISNAEFQYFIDDITSHDSTESLLLKVRVYDNVTGDRLWDMDYDISPPIHFDKLYNVSLQAHDAKARSDYTIKTIETSFPVLSKEVDVGCVRLGTSYYVRDSLNMQNIGGLKAIMKLADNVTANLPEYNFTKDWNDDIDRFTIRCGCHSVSYTELTVAKLDNLTKPKKLSDSINERYVDDIEHQLRGYLVAKPDDDKSGSDSNKNELNSIPTPKTVKKSVSIVSSEYDEPDSPSMPPLESVVVSIPEIIIERRAPHWIQRYQPVLFLRENTLRVVPTVNYTPISLLDRVLYEPNTDMNSPIYWNERENSWTSVMSNRRYLESLLGEAVIQKVQPQSHSQRLSSSVNETSSNENVRLVVQENQSKSVCASSNNTNNANPRKRKTRSSNEEHANVEHIKVKQEERTESVPANRELFVPRRSTRLQMKPQ